MGFAEFCTKDITSLLYLVLDNKPQGHAIVMRLEESLETMVKWSLSLFLANFIIVCLLLDRFGENPMEKGDEKSSPMAWSPLKLISPLAKRHLALSKGRIGSEYRRLHGDAPRGAAEQHHGVAEEYPGGGVLGHKGC